MRPTKCIAIKALCLVLVLPLLLAANLAFAAAVAGKVSHLSGPLLARKSDGTVKVLSQQSAVEEGDTLVTEKSTYAQIKFIDDSEITLKPDSQFKIDSFSFDPEHKEKDSAAFNLIKGGLRSVTGLLGKRSKERFGLNTPTATIGIRGTIFVVEYVESNPATAAAYVRASLAAADADVAPVEILQLALVELTGARAPGLYVQVLDGMVNLSNTGGSLNFAAGQFGFVPGHQMPPVILPNNPGMQFNPPPIFNTQTSSGPQSSPSPSKGIDCVVR